MKKVKLLNSAMMPDEGTYSLKRIDKEEFCKILKEAYSKGELESYIGYQENIDLIKKWTGIDVKFNRNVTTVDDGDSILVMKLKYRVEPEQKGKNYVGSENFEFFYCVYNKNLLEMENTIKRQNRKLK